MARKADEDKHSARCSAASKPPNDAVAALQADAAGRRAAWGAETPEDWLALDAGARADDDMGRDGLTKLYNRNAWDQAAREMAAAARDAACRLAILSVDVNGLRQINDALGHRAGDLVLATVAERLRGLLPCDALLARVGGDEFLAALWSDEEGAAALEKARDIVRRATAPVRFHDKNCHFGLGVGVAVSGLRTPDVGSLMSNADAALRRAKADGWNRYRQFTDDMRRATERRRQIADDLAAGIAERAIEPFFQAKVSADGYDIVGCEALVRWRHPTLGLLTPKEIIPAANALRLDALLDKLMLEQVAEARSRWLAARLTPPPISVNVTLQRLRDPDLIEDLERLDIPPGAVSFELIETSFLDKLDRVAAANLARLREMGIGVEIDDFGTGYASVAAVLGVRPNSVKIDRSLIKRVDGTGGSSELISLIVSLGRVIGAEVVAEGVDDPAQAEILGALGCKALQGFLFGRPEPEEMFIERLRARRPRRAPV